LAGENAIKELLLPFNSKYIKCHFVSIAIYTAAILRNHIEGVFGGVLSWRVAYRGLEHRTARTIEA
jgi:hypothetical protein